MDVNSLTTWSAAGTIANFIRQEVTLSCEQKLRPVRLFRFKPTSLF
jgi:hypothetical protein